MRYIIFCIAIMLNCSLLAQWTQVKIKNDTYILIDLRGQSNLNSWDFFHFTVFDLVEIIKYAKFHQYPLCIIVPENLNGVSPIDTDAPYIESIRTALAWARVCYLYENDAQWPLYICFTAVMKVDPSSLLEFMLSNAHRDSRQYDDINECVFYIQNIDMQGIAQEKHQKSEYCFQKNVASIKQINLPWMNNASNKLRFCISGGAGFLGSALVKKLLQEGHQVIVLDNLLCSTFDNLELIKNSTDFYFIQHDVSEPFTINGKIDVVVHLASVPSPADYYAMPMQTLRSGLQGTKNMLELARHNNARFIFSSTSEVYGDPAISPQSEDYPGNVNYLGPRSAYDQSKRAAETLIKLYFDTYQIDVRIARLFNTYGPGMRLHDGRVITNFIAAALENRPIKIYGDGSQTRSFGYVDDTICGLYKLIMADFSKNDSLIDRVFNIGTPVEFTIAELACKIESLSKKYLGNTPEIVCVRNPDNTDPHQRLPNISKAQIKLDFNPKICLDEGLEKTFLYFSACFSIPTTCNSCR